MRPLTLMTVSGDRLSGGDKEVALRLFFCVSAKSGQKIPHWEEEAIFHEADITVDAILGYPWLAAHTFCIWAPSDYLSSDIEPGWFLHGWQAQVTPIELDLASTECVVADSSQP